MAFSGGLSGPASSTVVGKGSQPSSLVDGDGKPLTYLWRAMRPDMQDLMPLGQELERESHMMHPLNFGSFDELKAELIDAVRKGPQPAPFLHTSASTISTTGPQPSQLTLLAAQIRSPADSVEEDDHVVKDLFACFNAWSNHTMHEATQRKKHVVRIHTALLKCDCCERCGQNAIAGRCLRCGQEICQWCLQSCWSCAQGRQ